MAGTKGRRNIGRHYQVPHSVADTVAYCSLSAHAQKLWHDLLLQYNGGNNGHIAAIFRQLAGRGWKGRNGTFYRALKELQVKGFIVKTRQGGTGAMKKICSLYRFTHLPTSTNPEIGIRESGPTNDYKNWKPEE
jgi:hypothetical protein